MAQSRYARLVTALDIGSAKICALIAGLDDDGRLTVLGTGQRQSQGVKRGYIADMDKVEQGVREAIEQAERIAGQNIEDVWVGFGAGGLTSDVSRAEIDLRGDRVEPRDVAQLLATGRASIDPEGRMVLHAQPALYTLDAVEGVKNPVGLHAQRLGVDIHIVFADAPPVRNLEMCVRGAHLDVRAIVAAPVATGLACLTDEERDIGVALVEIGAAVTNVSLFAGGMLVALVALPGGAGEITDDIASAFGIRRSEAERLKCFYGSATASPRDNHETIDLTRGEGGEPRRQATRAQLIAVIRERLDRSIGEVGRVLKDMGFDGPVGRQVVITGGGADLKGMADYVQGALGRSVRLGRPQGLLSLPEAHAGPAFATMAGLALYAATAPVDLRAIAPDPGDGTVVRGGGAGISRLIAAFRRNF